MLFEQQQRAAEIQRVNEKASNENVIDLHPVPDFFHQNKIRQIYEGPLSKLYTLHRLSYYFFHYNKIY